MPLPAAVFDFDVVIMDSEPLYFSTLRDALLPEGIEVAALSTDDRGWDSATSHPTRRCPTAAACLLESGIRPVEQHNCDKRDATGRYLPAEEHVRPVLLRRFSHM